MQGLADSDEVERKLAINRSREHLEDRTIVKSFYMKSYKKTRS